ncbi:MAG: MTH1187 family thiamine-binding protein [Desulfobacterales bacterium]|nr:MAG: MTH1187 family thiamine-binding protein [Desulfobacterales bacterium]
MSVLIDFSILPVGKGESVSSHISSVVTIVKNSKLPYKLGPMGTTVEGEWEDLMAVVTSCFHEMKKDCPRIYMSIRVDYREGDSSRIKDKVKSAERKQTFQLKK